MSDYYILDGHKAVPADLMTWGKWFGTTDRHVARETIGDADISTVFLGMDHSFGCGPPLLFETMVFGGKMDQEQDRCTTWDEAEKMHRRMVDRVRESLN